MNWHLRYSSTWNTGKLTYDPNTGGISKTSTKTLKEKKVRLFKSMNDYIYIDCDKMLVVYL
jgi:hypothetical protein